MSTLSEEQMAACNAHWARVRHGFAIEDAVSRVEAERRPGHRHIAVLRLAALVYGVPGRARMDAMRLRRRVGPVALVEVLRRARAAQFYGRRA